MSVPVSWEICMQVKKQQLELNMEQQTDSKLGKEYVKAVYCHPAYLTYMQSTSWEMLDWRKHKLESRLLGEISITSDMQMVTVTLMAESEEELKNLLMKVKEKSEKVGLTFRKLRSWHLVPSPHDNRNWNHGKSERLHFSGLQNHCRWWLHHEIQRRLLLGRKAMTNQDSTLKSRDMTLPTKVSLVKAMVFPVVMYGCESWTIKKAEPQRIDAFELCCWRRLLRVPWTAGRSNQSILKEISPE